MLIRRTGSFVAVDSKGRKFTIVRYQHSVMAQSFEAPDEEIETLGQLQTSDDRHVNPTENPDVFRILDPMEDEIEVRRVDDR